MSDIVIYLMSNCIFDLGIMSGCYHVCPNHTNFQFDTAFMYTISILILLKIYQTRHPDINANAYTAFGVLVIPSKNDLNVSFASNFRSQM